MVNLYTDLSDHLLRMNSYKAVNMVDFDLNIHGVLSMELVVQFLMLLLMLLLQREQAQLHHMASPNLDMIAMTDRLSLSLLGDTIVNL